MPVKIRTENNWLHFGLTDVQKLKLDKESTVGELSLGHYFGQFKNAIEFDNINLARKYVKAHKINMYNPTFEKYKWYEIL